MSAKTNPALQNRKVVLRPRKLTKAEQVEADARELDANRQITAIMLNGLDADVAREIASLNGQFKRAISPANLRRYHALKYCKTLGSR
jgi:hypothetical protein